MTRRILKVFLPLAVIVTSGFYAEVFAGKIELDNSSTTTTTQLPSTTTFLSHFSRFSLAGPEVPTGFAPAAFPQSGPTRVSVFSLSDYGIANSNLSQLGSLLQVRFNISLSGQAGSAQGTVSLFLIDPSDPQTKIFIGTKTISTSSSTSVVFTVADFGALPLNITPDFYIGLTGGVGLGNTGMSAASSTLAILSTVPTPEPTSVFLLFSGLTGSGISLWRRRRSS